MNSMLKDSDWRAIDGEPCKIIAFTPRASVKSGKVIADNNSLPYASIIFECKTLSQQTQGFIYHKMDFQHLWAVFNERGVKANEEVIIFWTKKALKSFAKIFSAFMPKLIVWICPKGAFEIMTNPESRPDLRGEAYFLAIHPILEWKPKVMK